VKEREGIMPKTREEIERLKADWEADPCWDIEDTEGFEEHREELLAFADEKRAEWDARYRARIAALAVELGIPNHTKAADQYDSLMGAHKYNEARATEILANYMDASDAERLADYLVSAAVAKVQAWCALELAKRGAAE
jgi:hypothetical protein